MSTTDKTTLISVKGLTLEAGPIRLFEDLSFQLTAGQGLILHGANGTGKTSLLRAIAGFNKPTDGQINFGTQSDPSVFNLPENCHYLGHQNGLKPQHTVSENLSFFRDFDPRKKLSIETVAQQLHFTTLLDLPVSVLSAGQRRRVAFSRLLVSHRPIWLLDEPTASLDRQTSQIFEQLAKTHLDEGGLIIAATHLPFLNGHDGCRRLNLEDYLPREDVSRAAVEATS